MFIKFKDGTSTIIRARKLEKIEKEMKECASAISGREIKFVSVQRTIEAKPETTTILIEAAMRQNIDIIPLRKSFDLHRVRIIDTSPTDALHRLREFLTHLREKGVIE